MSNRDIAIFSRQKQPSAFSRQVSPELNYVGFIKRDPGELFHHALHIDPPDVTELMLIRKGRCRLLFGGKHYVAGEGDLAIYNAGMWHEEHSEIGSAFGTIFVNFSGLQIGGLPPGYLVAENVPPIVGLGTRYFAIEQRFLEIYNRVESAGPELSYIADNLLGALLGEIVSLLAEPGEGTVKEKIGGGAVVPAVLRHIHENYDKRLTLAELGAVARISPYHLCRVFREQTGSSPIEYLINHRIEIAKLYLRTTDRKMAAIAGLVGYRSETQFQAVFRKIAGTTPGKYRTDYRQEGHRVSEES